MRVRILFVLHGSPTKIYHKDVERFEQEIVKRVPKDVMVDMSFIEHQTPLFAEKVDELDEDDSSDVVFIEPVFVLRAGHMVDDIEPKVRAVKSPEKFILRPPLCEREGFEKLYAEYVMRYLEHKKVSISSGTLFVFVGRGTSNENSTGDFYRFARLVWERIGRPGMIEISFAEVSRPSISDVFEFTRTERFENIVVVPLIIFRGYVERKVEFDSRRYGGEGVTVVPPIGYSAPGDLARFLTSPYRGGCVFR